MNSYSTIFKNNSIDYIKLPSLIHFTSLSLPMTSNPPFGYLIVWLFETGSVFCTFYNLVPLICLTIGCCWFIIAFMKDIMIEMTKLNRAFKLARHNTWELKVRFCNIIELYSEVKQLSKNLKLRNIFSIKNCNQFSYFYFYF